MDISDLIREAYLALSANKIRSGLTILGIVIGIGSVIAMISIGQGAKGSIESSIQSIGSNLIMIMPGMSKNSTGAISSGRGSANTLTQEDADAIKKEIALAKAVSPELSGRYQITAAGTNTNTQITGATSAYATVHSMEIGSGSFVSEQNLAKMNKVAVLGPTTRDDLFGEGADPIGKSIRINRIDFKVIGVTQSKGSSGFTNQDDMIFIPLSTLQKFLVGETRVSTINIQANDQKSMAETQQQITDLLLQRHNISNPQMADFSVMNQADIVATASAVTNTFTMLLASIAGISLLVGGIGIINMMLTTVTERTREIGLRKALGAQKKDINLQFLAESVMLTFLGGAIGIALGWAIAQAVTKFTNIPTKVSLSSIFLAFGVSAAIGIIFGYYPARRAAELNPIEALRYE